MIGSDAFDDWRRGQRAGFSDSPQVRGTIGHVLAVPEIVIICRTLGDARARFGVAHFASTLIGVLLGQSDVPIREGGDDAPPGPEDLVLALDAMETENGLHLVVRLLGPPAHRICWTGRHDLTTVAGADDWPERIRFANRIADQALLHLPVRPGRHGRVIGSAVRRIHSYRSAELEGAAVMLRAVVHDVDAGPLGRALALAWGSFATLTRVLEFRDTANSQIEQAVAAVDEAIRLAPAHPLVLALASQVVLRLGQDTDRAITLAARAMRADGDDPSALDVQSTALSLLGRRAEAERVAETARLAAAGRFNSFCWDVQACLTALAAGDLLCAQESARQAHRAEPGYRPALRYLLAIAMLRGDRDEAAVARTRLQRIEHDFRPTALIDPAYPMHMLHFLGLGRDLAPLIGDTA
ncbi:MAG: hypothetical protein Q4G49_10230 [Paracoccus sp. (in: a-proteobacteria)]|nr:hypothetical protein [Paracoccus sp. (in: a-proteobacteria)]